MARYFIASCGVVVLFTFAARGQEGGPEHPYPDPVQVLCIELAHGHWVRFDGPDRRWSVAMRAERVEGMKLSKVFIVGVFGGKKEWVARASQVRFSWNTDDKSVAMLAVSLEWIERYSRGWQADKFWQLPTEPNAKWPGGRVTRLEGPPALSWDEFWFLLWGYPRDTGLRSSEANSR